MFKKDVVFKYSDIQKYAFKNIKKAIMEAPTLMPPYFSKDFILYTFATDVSYASMLTHKNDEDVEIPMYFMRYTFKGVELNYTEVDK